MDESLDLFAPLVRAMAKRYQGPGLQREDLEQEGWLALLEAAACYCPELGARPAYYKSRVRAALGNVLRCYRRDGLFGHRTLEAEKPDWDGDQGEVWQLVAALPPRQRQTIQGYYREDLSLREIAAQLGISISAVSAHKKRGLATLKRQLTL